MHNIYYINYQKDKKNFNSLNVIKLINTVQISFITSK